MRDVLPRPATLTFHGAEHSVATGLGDRLGVWVPLFALAELWGNATVALRWAPAWKKLNARIAGDAVSAADCLKFPAYVQREATATQLSTATAIDLRLPMAGLQKGPEGPPTKPHHQLAYDRVPAILWWRWKLKGLLPVGSSGLDQFLAACRRAAYAVRCHPECTPPAARELEQRLRTARRRRVPTIFVHLRRGDRFMGADAQRHRFERATHKRLQEIVKGLAESRSSTDAMLPIEWVFLSDDADSAAAAQAAVTVAAANVSLPVASSVAPPNATAWAFTSFRFASGVVVSCNKDGWSSFSSVPALLHGVPLYCVSDNSNPPGGMNARHSYLPAEAIAQHHRDEQGREASWSQAGQSLHGAAATRRKKIALCWTTREEEGFARAVLHVTSTGAASG